MPRPALPRNRKGSVDDEPSRPPIRWTGRYLCDLRCAMHGFGGRVFSAGVWTSGPTLTPTSPRNVPSLVRAHADTAKRPSLHPRGKLGLSFGAGNRALVCAFCIYTVVRYGRVARSGLPVVRHFRIQVLCSRQQVSLRSPDVFPGRRRCRGDDPRPGRPGVTDRCATTLDD